MIIKHRKKLSRTLFPVEKPRYYPWPTPTATTSIPASQHPFACSDIVALLKVPASILGLNKVYSLMSVTKCLRVQSVIRYQIFNVTDIIL